MKLVIACLAIFLVGCQTSKTTKINEHIDYSSELQLISSSLESLRLDLNKQSQTTSEKLSNLKIKNTTTYYSLPDSTGKQYKVKESTNNVNKSDQESTKHIETLTISLDHISNKVDSIQNAVNQIISRKEEVKKTGLLDRIKEWGFWLLIIWMVIKAIFSRKNS